MPKISDLTVATTPLTGNELVPVVETPDGANNPKQTTTQDIADLASGGGSADTGVEPIVSLSPPVGTYNAQKTGLSGIDNRYVHIFSTHSSASYCEYTFAGIKYQIVVFAVRDFFTFQRVINISRRALPAGDWEQPVQLTAVPASPIYWKEDAHNSVTPAVDSTGRIWVTGNMHYDDLWMLKSTNVNSIATWTAVNPPLVDTTATPNNREYGSNGGGSYPRFIKLHDGQLLLYMRWNGDHSEWTFTTARSKSWIYKLNATTGAWTNALNPANEDLPLFDGATGTGALPAGAPYRGIYVLDTCVDSLNRVHFLYTWRFLQADEEGAEAGIHEKMEYIRVDGLTGTSPTVKKADGTTTLSFPITPLEGDTVIATTPTYDGTNAAAVGALNVDNRGYIEVDENDRPHTLCYMTNSPGPGNTRHSYWSGTAWVPTALNHRFWVHGIPDHGGLFNAGSEMYALVNVGGVKAVRMTPGQPGFGTLATQLVDGEFSDLTPYKDDTAYNQSNVITFPISAAWNNGAAGYGDDSWWQYQHLSLLRIDLNRWPAVARGEVRTPRMEVIGRWVGPENTMTITTATLAAIEGLGDLYHFLEYVLQDHHRYFVRLSVRSTIAAQNLVHVELQPFASDVEQAGGIRVINVGGTNNIQTSSWVPLYWQSNAEAGASTSRLRLVARAASIERKTLSLGGATGGTFTLTEGITSDVTAAIPYYTKTADLDTIMWRDHRLTQRGTLSITGTDGIAPEVGPPVVVGVAGGPWTINYNGNPATNASIFGLTANFASLVGGSGSLTTLQTGNVHLVDGTIPARGIMVELGVLTGNEMVV